MQCLKCSHKNPGTVAYCQRCGAKLDFTADEIAGALIENKREEIVHNTEFYAKQALTFAAAIFLIAATCLVLSLGAPEAVPQAVPSASNGSRYVELDQKMEGELRKHYVPLEVRKK
jgi:uncharacterized membrane protein YvbJ